MAASPRRNGIAPGSAAKRLRLRLVPRGESDRIAVCASLAPEAAVAMIVVRELQDAPARLTRRTCSFCAKRGALWAYCEPEPFALKTARDRVSTYQWRSDTVAHRHCGICGCGTYTAPPKWVDGKPDPVQRQIAVDARRLDALDLDAAPVVVIDGKNPW
jgi:hypothetical protein